MLKIILKQGLLIDKRDLTKHTLVGIRDLFTHNNPEYARNRKLGISSNSTPRFLYSYDEDENYIIIARGAKKQLYSYLKDQDIQVKVEDKRISKDLENGFEFDKTFILDEHQKNASDLSMENEHCLIQGECGSGKTEIALHVVSRANQRTLVIVHTTDLQKQWIKRAMKRFSMDENDIGTIGGKVKQRQGDGRLVIGTVQSVKNRIEKLKDDFGCVVVDEVHHSPASTFDKVINNFSAKYRFGFSATMKRKDGKHFLMKNQFGEIAYKITEKHGISTGRIMDVEVIIVKTRFFWEDYTIKVELENGDIRCDTDYKKYPELLTRLSKDIERNKMILSIIRKEGLENNKILILTSRRDHCKKVKAGLNKRGIECMLMMGGEDETQEAIKLMNDGKLRCAIGTTIADEWLDIPSLNIGIITTPSAANTRQIKQQIGRFRRSCNGKTKPKVYYFWDHRMHAFRDHEGNIRRLFKNVRIINWSELLNDNKRKMQKSSTRIS